jgi:hypothetical protein
LHYPKELRGNEPRVKMPKQQVIEVDVVRQPVNERLRQGKTRKVNVKGLFTQHAPMENCFRGSKKYFGNG